MMTREEIIQEYECAVVANGLAAAAGNEEAMRSYELFKAGLDALRPVSRERVEKVWKGEWVPVGDSTFYNKCSKCGKITVGKRLFCSSCGAPMTDEAVDMVMERLEALHETT